VVYCTQERALDIYDVMGVRALLSYI
jgi:hypothetical protein